MHFSKPLAWLFAAWLTLAVTASARPAGPICDTDPSNGARRAVHDMDEDSALVPSEFHTPRATCLLLTRNLQAV